MYLEEVEIENSSTPQGKGKILGVIILTDNRQKNKNDRSIPSDFRCSAFKQTQADPLQFGSGNQNYTYDEDLIAQLTKRVTKLEQRVEFLQNSDLLGTMQNDKENKRIKKKNRRKFKDLIRDHICQFCHKNYGSQTSLKYHLKLKHQKNQNHSQSD